MLGKRLYHDLSLRGSLEGRRCIRRTQRLLFTRVARKYQPRRFRDDIFAQIIRTKSADEPEEHLFLTH